MNHEVTYTKEVIDLKVEALNTRFSDQDKVLSDILGNVRKTNGRVTRMEKVILVIGAVVVTLLIVNGSSLVTFVGTLIK